jgi:hypothetical protein
LPAEASQAKRRRGIAQLVERAVWDREVGGSSPLSPTDQNSNPDEKYEYQKTELIIIKIFLEKLLIVDLLTHMNFLKNK